MSTKITLRIHNVKCVDETGGSFVGKFGNDEEPAARIDKNRKGGLYFAVTAACYSDVPNGHDGKGGRKVGKAKR